MKTWIDKSTWKRIRTSLLSAIIIIQLLFVVVTVVKVKSMMDVHWTGEELEHLMLEHIGNEGLKGQVEVAFFGHLFDVPDHLLKADQIVEFTLHHVHNEESSEALMDLSLGLDGFILNESIPMDQGMLDDLLAGLRVEQVSYMGPAMVNGDGCEVNICHKFDVCIQVIEQTCILSVYMNEDMKVQDMVLIIDH